MYFIIWLITYVEVGDVEYGPRMELEYEMYAICSNPLRAEEVAKAFSEIYPDRKFIVEQVSTKELVRDLEMEILE